MIVPDQAKSAGTLFALGADHLYLGPTSDLGPVDPQFRLSDGQWAAAKSIIAAVEEAERRVEAKPNTYAVHASLLSDLTALKVQQAREALERAGDQLREALASAPSRTEEQVDDMARALQPTLIDATPSHGAIISSQSAKALGLPVQEANPADHRWQAIWRLWAKYAVLNAARVYEGRHASFIIYNQSE